MSSTATLTSTSPAPAPAGIHTTKWTAAQWALMMVLGGALLLDGLDVSMVGVALPSIQTELGLSTSSLQWVSSGYLLAYGGLLLLGGRMADLLGRRKVFLAGVAVFALASVLGGLVDDGTLLIAARFVKGVAAAFTAPAGLSIVTTTFAEGPARNKALSIYTIFGASGYSMGLIAGGLLTEVGWRWTFLFPAPIALIVLLFAIKVVPKHSGEEKGAQKYDLGGAATLTAAMLLLVYTVVTAPEAGWGSLRTLGSFAAVLALIGLFVLIETRVAHPLVRLGIFKNRTLIGANLAALVVAGSYIGFQFIGTLYMQNLLKWSPLEMALALLPAGIVVLLLAPQADKLANRFGAPTLVAAGLLSFAPGYFWFLQIGQAPQYLVLMLPTVLLAGLGFALGFPGLTMAGTSGIDDDEQGLASGLVQTSFQVGAALVLAVVTAVITANGTPASPEETLGNFRTGLMVVAGVSLAGLVAVAITFRGRWNLDSESDKAHVQP